MRRLLLLLIVLLVACTGCLHIREKITLHPDGSGIARVEVSFPKLGLRFLPGEPTMDWIQPHLPADVQLLSFDHRTETRTFRASDGKQHELDNEIFDVEISFDRVSALNQIRVRPDSRNRLAAVGGAAPGMALADSPKTRSGLRTDTGPFQEVTLIEAGELLKFRRVVQAARDPGQTMMNHMNTPGSVKPEVVDLADSSMIVTIECPGEVMAHNADQLDGRTLTWTFKLRQLETHQDRDWTIEFTCRREGRP